MKTSKRWTIAAAFVLLAVLASSVNAQRKADLRVNNLTPPISIATTVELKLDSIELTDGVVGLSPDFGETLFGYSFLGRTSGDLPGSFMLSMNCVPAVFNPGESNFMSGGSWALPVYMTPFRGLSNVYMGSLYGKVIDGKMGWDKLGNAEVYFNFSVDGGTETWNGVTGSGRFEGTLIEQEKGPATLNGLLTITYSSTTTQ